MIEYTIYTKAGGHLSKRIELQPDGSIKSDASECRMAHGKAKRAFAVNMQDFAGSIAALRDDQAIGLGRIQVDATRVTVVTKSRLNGAADTIARSATYIDYAPGQPALALGDLDTKGMPQPVANRLASLGGFWSALVSVVPELSAAGRVVRASTSAGLYRTDTEETIPGSNGLHAYFAVSDGADIVRFLRALHERCWLAGLGWYMLGASGQLLERSIIDPMVGQPERLVFEGGPIVIPPVEQDKEQRRPVHFEGKELDTLAAAPPLTVIEKAKIAKLKAEQKQTLAPAVAKARGEFIARQAGQIAKRTGMSLADAKLVVNRQCEGILRPCVVLPFDDDELAGKTAGDVLADPDRFVGETLADPLEGIAYGRGKAKIMRRDDGTPWVHSFAHGRTCYELKYDAKAVLAEIYAIDPQHAVATFIRLALLSDLAEDETDMIRDKVAVRSGTKTLTIKRMLKLAFARQQSDAKAAEREHAAYDDPRPTIAAPAVDAPWMPVIETIYDAVDLKQRRPPCRNVNGVMVKVRLRTEPPDNAFSTAN